MKVHQTVELEFSSVDPLNNWECDHLPSTVPVVTAKHHGGQTYKLSCGLSPAPFHVYYMSPSAKCGSVCHMFTCCSTMYDLGEGSLHVICLCDLLNHLSNKPLTFAIFNCEVMDLECFGK